MILTFTVSEDKVGQVTKDDFDKSFTLQDYPGPIEELDIENYKNQNIIRVGKF